MEQQNLWFRPLDLLGGEEDHFLHAREEAWLSSHGTMAGFDGQAFLEQARRDVRHDPRSLMCAMLEERRVGLVHMDLLHGGEEGVGYIPFCYMDEQTRGRGYGVQLLGQAVSTFRPMGCDRLRLRCAPENETAQRFYKRYGFSKIGPAADSPVPLDLMEKYIGYKDLRE